MFPQQSRPQYVSGQRIISDLPTVCDRALVIAKAWEVEGTGGFIGEPLAADLLRAVAYKRIQWQPSVQKPSRLRGGFVIRKGKRKIRNHSELWNALNTTYYSQVVIVK